MSCMAIIKLWINGVLYVSMSTSWSHKICTACHCYCSRGQASCQGGWYSHQSGWYRVTPYVMYLGSMPVTAVSFVNIFFGAFFCLITFVCDLGIMFPNKSYFPYFQEEKC